MVESVGVAVVRARRIIERVLNELEPLQPDRLQKDVIGAAGFLKHHAGCPHCRKRREPIAENGHHGGVILGVDAAHLARPVIEIEIGGQLAIAGLGATPGTDTLTILLAFAEPTAGAIPINWSAS